MNLRRLAGQAIGITPKEMKRTYIAQDLDGTYVLGQVNNVGEDMGYIKNIELGPYQEIGVGASEYRPGFVIANNQPLYVHPRSPRGRPQQGVGPKEAAETRRLLAEAGYPVLYVE